MSAAATSPDQEITRADGSARLSLWWREVPSLPGERLGIAGNFAAETEEAAKAVLHEADAVLREHGCTMAVGPMNQNTWFSYRFVTDPGTEPPFLLEPVNPPEWPRWWEGAGYRLLAEYYSSLVSDLGIRDERLGKVRARMQANGITIRRLRAEDYEAELDRIYEVSAVSFQGNYLYTPLSREGFQLLYARLRERVIPEIVLLAEQDGHPAGFVFCIPDYAEKARNEPLRTVIVKTLAVLPGRAFAGLGALLLEEAHRAALQLGYSRGIHALMHETNTSRNLSGHYGTTMRRYGLYAKAL